MASKEVSTWRSHVAEEALKDCLLIEEDVKPLIQHSKGQMLASADKLLVEDISLSSSGARIEVAADTEKTEAGILIENVYFLFPIFLMIS